MAPVFLLLDYGWQTIVIAADAPAHRMVAKNQRLRKLFWHAC
jgi:hypothetical protein